MFKKEKIKQAGITLIALVVTIVVLLILAGATLTLVLGNKGIIKMAGNAAKATNEETKSSQDDRDKLYSDIVSGDSDNPQGNQPVASGGWQSDKNVNAPTLEQGMIPIKYNGTNWVVCSKEDSDWYNYTAATGTNDNTSSVWANVMLSDGTYKSDTVAVGTVIEDTRELGSMFVWIPRYAYQIMAADGTSTTTTSGWHTNVAGIINIKFLKDTSNIASDGSSTWDNEPGNGEWNIHPAFHFGVTELSGIWVAKFESSNNNNNIKIVPNTTSWTLDTVSTIFDKCITMGSEYGNIYGMSNATSRPHLMKNSEWGAVAYLTQSSYGRNMHEITANDSSLLLTGGGDYKACTNESTTGNVYGIYDMSGGNVEAVAAYRNSSNSTALANGTDLVAADSQYKDCNENYLTLGNAMGETTSWYGDWLRYATDDAPFYYRGGYATDDGVRCGIFAFFSYPGNISSGFRVVIIG